MTEFADRDGDNPVTDDLMTPGEVATFLRVEKRWVYDASRRGLIPSTKVGKFLRFHRTDVEAFVRLQPTTTPEG